MEVALKATMLFDSLKVRIPTAVVKTEPTKGQIWFDIEQGEKHVVVEVRETGFGVSDYNNSIPFTGPQYVFEQPEETVQKVEEILKS